MRDGCFLAVMTGPKGFRGDHVGCKSSNVHCLARYRESPLVPGRGGRAVAWAAFKADAGGSRRLLSEDGGGGRGVGGGLWFSLQGTWGLWWFGEGGGPGALAS